MGLVEDEKRRIHELEIMKARWKIMVKNYFKLLERERIESLKQKTSCPSG